MPRAAKGGAGGAKKSPAPKAHKLPERFPSGEILHQLELKKKWQLGDIIGQGGFGLIYKAYDVTDGPANMSQPYVIKIEPINNGPLFCEIHFYKRVVKPESMTDWIKLKKLRYLAVPQFLGVGHHTKGDKQYRFLVLQHLSTDLYKVWEQSGRCFSEKTTFCVGLRILDALEYIHDNSYCHADIKAANILLGYSGGETDFNQVYLVDYGLAYRFLVDGAQKPYKEDPKRAHDGTVEYASRDAHKGVWPSRRGDLEILGYCMLEWLSGNLPWNRHLADKDKVRDLKIMYMNNLPDLFTDCFGNKKYPEGLKKYFNIVSKLAYDEKPDYSKLRQYLRSGINNEWTLGLNEGAASPTKGVKRKSESAGPSTPKKKRPSSSPSSAKQRVQAVDSASKVADGTVSSPALVNGKSRNELYKSRSKAKTAARTSSKGKTAATCRASSNQLANPAVSSPSQHQIIPGLGVTKAEAKAAKMKAGGNRGSWKPTSKTSSAVDSPSGSQRGSVTAGKGRARTPQRRKRNKAVVSSDSSCQTSPSMALLK